MIIFYAWWTSGHCGIEKALVLDNIRYTNPSHRSIEQHQCKTIFHLLAPDHQVYAEMPCCPHHIHEH
ncbi:hypothetical protein GWI33_010873 [Rhynchophorus ferrugineus]|uniref:Uncharacterized protein n=1 Tax=Rhynchophorus ferrugineus TaxID=354439 RepID=A0A834MC28_RHYFE|nr:hypothetical protein GWI33_010873 [Rhynchophorus ferrugineus]